MNGHYNLGEVVLGNWKLKRKLGEGSFGKVYEAERVDFGVTYKSAIKIITIPQSDSEVKTAKAEGMDEHSVTAYFRGFVEEVVQEFVLLSELKGTSNIVSYEDHTVVEYENGVGWDIIIRMELLTPLLDYVQNNKLTRRDVTKLGIDMCKALELCQKYNIVHRDIKPENIFVSKLGDYKLGDFGIARTVEKTTGGLSKKGTYTYMAPEVYKEEPYNSSVDIYSLGIVMYSLLNENRAPFLPFYPAPITHSDREGALAKRLSGAKIPEPKNADGRLSEIVLKACAYQPKDRYSSPMQMKQELEAIIYDRAEADVIYPNGDEASIKPVENIPTDKHQSIKEEKLARIFGSHGRVNPEGADTLPTASGDEDSEKTESIFGSQNRAVIERADTLPLASIDESQEKTESVFAKPVESQHPKEVVDQAKSKGKIPMILTLLVAVVVTGIAIAVGISNNKVTPNQSGTVTTTSEGTPSSSSNEGIGTSASNLSRVGDENGLSAPTSNNIQPETERSAYEKGVDAHAAGDYETASFWYQQAWENEWENRDAAFLALVLLRQDFYQAAQVGEQWGIDGLLYLGNMCLNHYSYVADILEMDVSEVMDSAGILYEDAALFGSLDGAKGMYEVAMRFPTDTEMFSKWMHKAAEYGYEDAVYFLNLIG